MKLKLNDAMPFGKYKGKLISDIPSSYLDWASRNTDIVFDDEVLSVSMCIQDPSSYDELWIYGPDSNE